jgi:hypothetical protein
LQLSTPSKFFALAAVVLALAAAAIGCDGSVASPQSPAASTSPLRWDLSTDHGIARVQWPWAVTDTIWFIDGPQTVHLLLPGHEEGDVTFYKAQIRRQGNTLYVVCLEFPSETVDQAYARAAALAKQWNITDLVALEKWHRTRGASVENAAGYLSLTRTDLPQPRGIQIRHAFDPRCPWFVSLGFGYPAAETPSSLSAF